MFSCNRSYIYPECSRSYSCKETLLKECQHWSNRAVDWVQLAKAPHLWTRLLNCAPGLRIRSNLTGIFQGEPSKRDIGSKNLGQPKRSHQQQTNLFSLTLKRTTESTQIGRKAYRLVLAHLFILGDREKKALGCFTGLKHPSDPLPDHTHHFRV